MSRPTPTPTPSPIPSSRPESPDQEARPPCPAPANFCDEVAAFDQRAEVGTWDGPHYRMTYRMLGQGPPLILNPGIAATYRVFALLLNGLAERFRTIVYDYPGEHPDDGARLRRLTHDHLVENLFGLIEHLNLGRVFLVGPSFGSTITLKALHREPRRFPRAALQGAFAHRRFTWAEKLALMLGRCFPGTVDCLPLRNPILTWNHKCHFPAATADRWEHYLEQNGLTPIAPLAHRLDLVAHLDLRPILPEIPTEILLIQGNEDRLIPHRHHDELLAALPNARSLILPTVGHLPHYTHAELLAHAIGEFFLPCNPEGCPNERENGHQ